MTSIIVISASNIHLLYVYVSTNDRKFTTKACTQTAGKKLNASITSEQLEAKERKSERKNMKKIK